VLTNSLYVHIAAEEGRGVPYRPYCGSGQFLTGSGSDFRKHLIRFRILTLIHFLSNFFLKFFGGNWLQKVKKHRFPKYLWLLHTLKKLIQSHLLRPGSGCGPRRPDPDQTKKVQIRTRNTAYRAINQCCGAASFLSAFGSGSRYKFECGSGSNPTVLPVPTVYTKSIC
jgi:hypothetical protein